MTEELVQQNIGWIANYADNNEEFLNQLKEADKQRRLNAIASAKRALEEQEAQLGVQ